MRAEYYSSNSFTFFLRNCSGLALAFKGLVIGGVNVPTKCHKRRLWRFVYSLFIYLMTSLSRITIKIVIFSDAVTLFFQVLAGRMSQCYSACTIRVSCVY